MTSRLTGMGLLTHVQHPLERLGDLVEAEQKRQRAIVIAERWRIVRTCLAGGAVGGSLFGTAVVAFAMLTGEANMVARAPLPPEAALAPQNLEAPPAAPEAQAAVGSQPMLWPQEASTPAALTSDHPAAVELAPRPQAGISLQAQALASFGEPMPRDAVAQSLVEVDDEIAVADVVPREDVPTVVAALDDVRAVSTLVLSGLPRGSSVEHGVDVGDGTFVIPGDRGHDIDVKLPDQAREPVRAEVELIGPDGARASGFALTIRPSSGVSGRVQRALRTDEDIDGKKPRRKKKAKAVDPAKVAASGEAQMRSRERAWSEDPSYVGRGIPEGESRSRRDQPSERRFSRDDDGPPEPSKGWSLFGLFGGQ